MLRDEHVDGVRRAGHEKCRGGGRWRVELEALESWRCESNETNGHIGDNLIEVLCQVGEVRKGVDKEE